MRTKSIIKYNTDWRSNNKDKVEANALKYRKLSNDELIKRKNNARFKKIKKRLEKNTIKNEGRLLLGGKLRPEIDIFGNKKCSKCGEWKPNNEKNFNKEKRSRDGFKSVCRECKKKQIKRHRHSDLKIKSKLYKRLSIYEELRENPTKEGFVQVRCAYCGKWISVTNNDAHMRVSACESVKKGENRIYCPGDQCRQACPTYGQQAYPKGFKKNTSREVDPLIRHMCMERDNYTCQKCGATGEGVTLHAHHILSYARNKIVANDIQNVITLCKACHNEVHHLEGCKYYELRCG